MEHERIELMGLEIDALSEPRLIDHVLRSLEQGRGGWIITANLDQLRQFRACPKLRPMFSSADLVVADGMPLVWASWLQRTPLPGRVAGSDLVWSLSAQAASAGRRLYLLGDEPLAREKAAEVLRETFPSLVIAGASSPPMGFEPDADSLGPIRDALREAQPDIVYVALGFPKQERVITALREEFPQTWFIGVGISLSFLGGQVKRAPSWVSKLGLEWLHRLIQEPRRLGRRYLVHGLPFGIRLLLAASVSGVRRRENRRTVA